MNENPLLKLEALGQSIWMDFIRRGSITSGELQRWISEDGITGVTSNPSIFEKAIAGSHDYDEAVRALALEGKNHEEMYESVTVADIQRAADLFRPIFDRTKGADGFVSIEVSPGAAHNTQKTLDEAHNLWRLVARPNVMIKVPATKEGLPAIRQLIGEGINVNITLLFGLPRYREVVEAYIGGLEDLQSKGKPVDSVASVASFFLSRIDVLLDPKLEEMAKSGGQKADLAKSLVGQVAIASAKVAYEIYQEMFSSPRFNRLKRDGAKPQRLLWASTSTKNPAYSDVKYVEALIGPDTVDTLPTETLEAYRDHGKPQRTLDQDVDHAHRVLDGLAELGLSIDQTTQQLEDEGVEKFAKAYNQLMQVLDQRRDEALKEPPDRMDFSLGGFTQIVDDQISDLRKERFAERLWRKEAALWKADPKTQEQIHNSLGWLHVAEKVEENLQNLSDFVKSVKEAGFRHVLHMGMGGSSLAPLAFARTFDPTDKGLPLSVLDTTDPATILHYAQTLPLADTLFIVASKSGTTAEPEAFFQYFYDQVKAIKGEQAGENFVAITDPGTPLVKEAEEHGFRKVFLNFSDIGGRYSALSYFGMLPAALMGLEVGELLVRALRMQHACDSCVPAEENPGLRLGAAMGSLAQHHHDKVTFLMPEHIASLGLWLEQLLAESTGKEGKGLLPVANERLGRPMVYGNDRLFVYFRLKGAEDQALEDGVTLLRSEGYPVITIQMDDPFDLAQEFIRWEIATVTAGAVLGINPLDQPNVQESKDNTNRLLDEARRTGKLTEPQPVLTAGPLRLYADQQAGSAAELLRTFFDQARPGDYLALQAYLQETDDTNQALQDLRTHLRDILHLATTLGYGPRFLHSTGQYHKGGPNTGLFIQLTAHETEDAPIPGQPYTFETFIQAQAQGDLEALRKHGRRVLRIDLGSDMQTGLDALRQAVEAALTGISAPLEEINHRQPAMDQQEPGSTAEEPATAGRQPMPTAGAVPPRDKSMKEEPSVTKEQSGKASSEREQSGQNEAGQMQGGQQSAGHSQSGNGQEKKP